MRARSVTWVDVLLAVVVGVALVVLMATQMDPEPGERDFDLLAGLCTAAAAGGLVLHRRAPMACLVIAAVAMTVYGLRGYLGGPVYVTTLVGMFALANARGTGEAWVPAGIAASAVIAAPIVGGTAQGDRIVIHLLYVSWGIGAVLLGGLARSRRLEREALEERARHLAETRDEEARRRVAEERVRIARELHDSVAHSLASIAVQAGVGAHLLDERPEEARAALHAIKQASGEALGDLRTTLGMLRSGEGETDGEGVPRRPVPGLDQLDALVDGSRRAGLPVELTVEGEPVELPLAVDLTAYRIVQESLTNVLRHAGPATARVAIRYEPGAVEIEVSDDGTGPARPDHQGHGLPGMRERAALVGGSVHAGARPGGGFRVRAVLPLEPVEPLSVAANSGDLPGPEPSRSPENG